MAPSENDIIIEFDDVYKSFDDHEVHRGFTLQVRRGETGIKVLAPITRREPRLNDAGQPVRDDEGRAVHQTYVVGTKPVTVFDIRQTDGPPLPNPKILSRKG